MKKFSISSGIRFHCTWNFVPVNSRGSVGPSFAFAHEATTRLGTAERSWYPITKLAECDIIVLATRSSNLVSYRTHGEAIASSLSPLARFL